MQSLTTNSATLSPQVQAILPVLENLKADDYYFLLNFLKNKSEKIETKNNSETSIAQKRFNRFPNAITQDNEQALPLSREEIAKKRLGFFQGQMTMSDDFDEYLGDDFWFPEDDILYK